MAFIINSASACPLSLPRWSDSPRFTDVALFPLVEAVVPMTADLEIAAVPTDGKNEQASVGLRSQLTYESIRIGGHVLRASAIRINWPKNSNLPQFRHRFDALNNAR